MRLSYDRRILLIALVGALPGLGASLLLLRLGGYTTHVTLTVVIFITAVWLWAAFSVRSRVVTSLQTIANLLGALREEDFSIRGRSEGVRGDPRNDAFDAVMLELNELTTTLHHQRLGAIEAGALLRSVMSEIDVAVFTFDGASVLRLVNRAGERLLGLSSSEMLGQSAHTLGLSGCLDGPTPRIEDVAFAGGSGRWEVRRTTFREDGKPHQLVVLADVSRPLRDEERQAWQRLIRVIGHEINNSLAPIKSIAGSLESMLKQQPLPVELHDDMTHGLEVISARSDALSRFTTAYSQLAKLPAPAVRNVRIDDLVSRVVKLETRLPVRVEGAADVVVRADPDQLEQLLINLLHNAVDAALEANGAVSIGWRRDSTVFTLWIDDEGAGVSNAANLFVPFFTTKPGGSGIGLVLSRQIAEAHGGSLTLENRPNERGCRALLRLAG